MAHKGGHQINERKMQLKQGGKSGEVGGWMAGFVRAMATGRPKLKCFRRSSLKCMLLLLKELILIHTQSA